MLSTSIKLPDTTVKSLDDYAAERYDENRSEAIRELLAKGLEYDERISALETERDRLRRELRATNARQEDVGELVEYVDERRSIERRRAAREDRRRSVNMFRRAWWFVTGEPASE